MEHLDIIKNKLFDQTTIQNQCHIWRFKDKKIVFTNGCFDILHLGHIEYLAKAADCGKALVIGLNSDLSVKAIKGEGRPLNPEYARMMTLASLSFVDAIVLFDEETPYNLIRLVQPDVLVKGADYTIDEIVGHDVVMANGGEVITIPLTSGYSTTSILAKLTAEWEK